MSDPISAKSGKGLGTSLFIAAVCLIGTVFWVLAAGSDLPGKPSPAERPVPPDAVLDFTALYATHCAACHGAGGKLGPAPPLDDPLFRAIVPQDVLEQVVSAGRPGTPMPGFDRQHGGRLTAAQIQVLAFQIKGVKYRIVAPPTNGEGKTNGETTGETKIVEDPEGIASAWGWTPSAPRNAPAYLAPTQESSPAHAPAAADRIAIFNRTCAKCHGKHGEGADAGAIDRPDFLALASDQFLRRIIITGRPDLGMPNYKSSKNRPPDFKPLTSAEIDQLVSLLGQWRESDSAAGGAAHAK